MNMLMNLLMFLDATNVAVGNQHDGLNKIFQWAIWAGGAIIAVIMIFSIVKSAKEYALGSGSGGIGKIIGKVIFLVFCLGMIALASNWDTIAGRGEKLAEAGLNIVENLAEEVAPGN